MGNNQSRVRRTNSNPNSRQNFASKAAAQQLKENVKNLVKSESIRRAGNQGADPWGDNDELITQQTLRRSPFNPFGFGGGTIGGSPFSTVAGQEPDERNDNDNEDFPAFLTQPLTLLNRNGANGATNGSTPQSLNYSVVYFSPTEERVTRREVINCCEDCCEDICENCFLNCCLDCARLPLPSFSKQKKPSRTRSESPTESPLITGTTIGNISI